MNIKSTAVVLSALALSLSACGGGDGGSDGSTPSTPAPTSSGGGEGQGAASEGGDPKGEAGIGYPVKHGGVYTYPDGLRVGVGNWRVVHYGGDPEYMAKVDVTVSNPTKKPITTTQAWLSVRAGGAGAELDNWAEGEPVDNVLQPGAKARGTYSFTAPKSKGHVVATVTWDEAKNHRTRYPAEFSVED